jgi:uncharacterized membrane protein
MSERLRAAHAHASEDRGAVLPLVALSVVILLVMTSLTVDLGRLSLRRRDLQAVADVMSLDLVRLVDGRTKAEIQGDPSWSATIAASRARNDFAPSGKRTLQPRLGCYAPLTSIFTESCSVPDAVRVVVGDTVPFYFQAGERTTSRSAIAQRGRFASFSVGSTLAEARSGNSTLLDPLLGDLLGGSVDIGAVGYQGLASANVSLQDLAFAGGFGGVDELLDADLTAGEFGAIAAQALTNRGDGVNAEVFGQQVAGVPNDRTFSLGDFVEAQPGGPGTAESATINLFEVLVMGAIVANGDNFLDISNVVDTSAIAVPGAGPVTTTSAYRVIESPQLAYRVPVGGTASTAQLRVETTVSIPIDGLVVEGLPSPAAGMISVPVLFTGADARGTLTRIDCNEPVADSVIDLATGLQPLHGTVAVDGELTVVGLDAISVTGSQPMTVAPPTSGTLLDVFVTETRAAPGNQLDLGGVLRPTDITVTAAGIDASTREALESGLAAIVNPVLTAVTAALQPALNALGVETGSADLTNVSVECGGPGLAA